MIKALVNNYIYILLEDTTNSRKHNIYFPFRVEFDNLNVKISQIVLSQVG